MHALVATDGSELFRFGARGTEAGQFANFVDVDVSEAPTDIVVVVPYPGKLVRGKDGSRGYEVYTIGLGADADAALLGELATTPDRYVPAPSALDLAVVYAGIAGRLVGCP